MIKYLHIFLIFFFIVDSNANNKENIINNLKIQKILILILSKILIKKLKKEIAS